LRSASPPDAGGEHNAASVATSERSGRGSTMCILAPLAVTLAARHRASSFRPDKTIQRRDIYSVNHAVRVAHLQTLELIPKLCDRAHAAGRCRGTMRQLDVLVHRAETAGNHVLPAS